MRFLIAMLLACVLAGCGIDTGQLGLDPGLANGDGTSSSTGTTGTGGSDGTSGTGTLFEDGNRDPSLTSPLGKTSGEPNDTFADAIVGVFDPTGLAQLQGTVIRTGDLDVYRLGPIMPGDRLIVDADTTTSFLDVSVGIFDDLGRLAYPNDDRSTSGSRSLDSFIEWVARHGGDPYFLVVTHSAFAARGRTVGRYFIDVQVDGGFPTPPPAAQVILLDFDGAVIDSPVLGTMTLEPFDAARISPIYQGATQTIKDSIRAVFEQNFARFNVTIVTTDDPPLPAGSEFTSIFFGGFNSRAFGLSENVDLYNADFCDDAMIFTESFNPQFFSHDPTATEMGVAIGNVGAHEAGHLLGLNHVNDDRALMDDVSAADALLDDQEFMEAPLSSDIMQIGTQDAVLLLEEIVGLR